jgi:hypothetical protein
MCRAENTQKQAENRHFLKIARRPTSLLCEPRQRLKSAPRGVPNPEGKTV